MKPYRVVVTDSAWDDLRAAGEFIANSAPERAGDWLESMIAAMESPGVFPHRCPTAGEQSLFSGEVRHLIQHPYRIIFRVEAGVVTVLRVRHGAQRPRPLSES